MFNYLDLSIGAKRRLNHLKQYAQRHNEKHGINHRTGKPMTWRDCRYSGFHNARSNQCQLSPGFNGETPIWYCHTGPYFNREQWADELLGLRNTGYYADVDCCNTVRGIVVLLPHGRCLAGYYVSDNGERVYYGEVYDDKEQAAREANHYAERYAELEREHSECFHEASRLQNQLDETMARIRECLVMRNNPCFDYVRGEIHDLVEKVRDMRETLARDYADVL